MALFYNEPFPFQSLFQLSANWHWGDLYDQDADNYSATSLASFPDVIVCVADQSGSRSVTHRSAMVTRKTS